MNNDIVIDISSSGQVKGMHRDEFNLGFLGAQRITRASDIRFDEKTQNWRIWLANDEIDFKVALPSTHTAMTFTLVDEVGAFPTYNSARDFEVLWLNTCMRQDVAPLSDDGKKIGRYLYLYK